MADIEHSFISKLVHSGGMVDILRAGINGRFFNDVEHGEVWDWALEFWNRYGKEPDRETLRLEYPNYRLAKTPEPLSYYIERLLEYHKRSATIHLAAKVADYLDQEEIDLALGEMSDGVYKIARATANTEDEDVISTWEERLKRWEKLEESVGELVGIPTGFKFIDQATGGYQPEQFIVLIGPNKSGKSSIVLQSAIAASNAGYSVVFVSFEMSNQEQEARHDGIRGGFNPNLLLQGKMTPKQKHTLRMALKRIEENPPIHFIHDMGARNLSGTIAKVHQYKPDLVIVDGMYLMDAEIPGVEGIDTKALTKISRSLKVLAQTQKIPVVGTHQALDWKWSAKKGLTTGSAGYTSAFGQDCDLMLGIEPPENDDNLAKLRIVTGRNVGRQFAFIRYDWDHGTIEEEEEDTSWGGGDDDDEEDDD